MQRLTSWNRLRDPASEAGCQVLWIHWHPEVLMGRAWMAGPQRSVGKRWAREIDVSDGIAAGIELAGLIDPLIDCIPSQHAVGMADRDPGRPGDARWLLTIEDHGA